MLEVNDELEGKVLALSAVTAMQYLQLQSGFHKCVCVAWVRRIASEYPKSILATSIRDLDQLCKGDGL